MSTDVGKELDWKSDAAPLRSALRRALAFLSWRLEKRRSRRAIAELTRDQLQDIGITPEEASAEIGKSWFWNL
ncbi:hypothetical protein PMI09_03659 [Rhizobium sp. CF122]|uniref:DUF1127 domain-containing protein n=1 Tax=Rhizobium sp. CF122 TaxID=1144312 RepID=UPI0002717E09|nr:DUF1127 domain-containing protein [Rhizobium sp. CF122]EJL52755.1 hypothetical protein PMI09_03659 [Rhizobium sp. CF122]